MDQKNGYNLISIAARDSRKIAFCTKHGLFKYTVMPFGLTNAPVSFQEMMDTIIEDMEACIWYFNDRLVHSSNTEREHGGIVEQALQ